MGKGDIEVSFGTEDVSLTYIHTTCCEASRRLMSVCLVCGSLRRAFLLIDALHGVKSTDAQLLTIFRENAIPHQIILSKVDRILFPTSRNPSPKALEANLSTLKKTMGDLRQIVQPPFDRHPPALGEILTCSAEKSVERGKKMGVSGIRWAMLAAAGLERNTSYVDLKTAE